MAPTTAPVIEFPSPGAELQYQTTAPGALVVQSPAEYTAIAEHLKTIKTFQRRVTDWFSPLKRKAQDAHQALCIEERKVLTPSIEDEGRIKRALVTYTTEQDRIRRQEQLRLQQEAREREEAARLEQAAALEREGTATGEASYTDAAQALMDAPMAIAPVEPETPAAPKVEGLSYRTAYSVEVFNLDALPAQYIIRTPMQKVLDALAADLKSAFNVPGCRLVVTKTPVTRTR